MGKIFFLMGKSATGKDTIFKHLLARDELNLTNIVPYTTRPIRKKETDGVEYHFCDEAMEDRLERSGKVIEKRVYDTKLGRWAYFTVDDGLVDLNKSNYLVIGTLDSYEKIAAYYKRDNVIPIYIEAEDSVRLERAIRREKKQAIPKFDEVCRRFLADAEDFAPAKLKDAGVEYIFTNHGDISDAVDEIAAFIRDQS